MPGATSRGAFPYSLGSDDANTIDTSMQALAQQCADIGVIFDQGSFASRPISTVGTPGVRGRFYYSSDIPRLDYDMGTGWVQFPLGPFGVSDLQDSTVNVPLGLTSSSVRRGKSIIATEESRTNTAYGLLSTPDRVQNIVLPTDGLIFVGYQALWKSSVVSAASASVFVGSNALVLASAAGASSGSAIATGLQNADVYNQLGTWSGGLTPGNKNAGSDAAHSTTGQAIGVIASTAGAGAGVCSIFAAAGTYDISVQFKASSGSVSVKDRKLWVWTMGF